MKVIFFDIDGTLSNFEGVVPESAIQGIKKTQKAGNITALCSGRSESQIDADILAVGFDAIVSAAGAHVSVNGQTIYESVIPPDKYESCLSLIQKDMPDLCVQTNEAVYVREDGYDKLVEFTAGFAQDDRDPDEVVGNLKRLPTLSGVANVQKMFYHRAPITVEEVNRRIGDYFMVTELSFGKPDPYCGEITVRGVEKSTGMDELMRYYGLSREDSVAFGDGPNDVDMMEYARIAVAMGNGRDEIKALADFVTADVDDDGIYKGLEHLVLL